MDRATKAALVMGMFTGEPDYRTAENICVVCGQERFQTFACAAMDPAGRRRGVCPLCMRARCREMNVFNDREAIHWFLDRIKDGRL